jgi:hypothetical protein
MRFCTNLMMPNQHNNVIYNKLKNLIYVWRRFMLLINKLNQNEVWKHVKIVYRWQVEYIRKINILYISIFFFQKSVYNNYLITLELNWKRYAPHPEIVFSKVFESCFLWIWDNKKLINRAILRISWTFCLNVD